MLRKLGIPGFMLAAALALVAAPADSLEAASCGGPGVAVCYESEECFNFLIFSSCTTEWDYWQRTTTLV